MGEIDKSGISRRAVLASGGAALLLSEPAAATKKLPKCYAKTTLNRDDGIRNGYWYITANQSHYSLSRGGEAYFRAGLRPYEKHPFGHVMLIFHDTGQVEISGQLDRKFRQGRRTSEFAFVARGKGVSFCRGGECLETPASLRLLADGETVVEEPLRRTAGGLWERRKQSTRAFAKDLEPGLTGAWLDADSTRYLYLLLIPDMPAEELERRLRRASTVRLVLVDDTGDLTGAAGEFWGVDADFQGADLAIDKGKDYLRRIKAVLEARKCRPDKNCFVTTACCEALGRPDDCWELETLRRYRDRVLASLPGGRADIAAYYETAPRVLARLPQSGFRRWLLLFRIYCFTVLPCALLARAGANRLVRRHYTAMLTRLARRAEV